MTLLDANIDPFKNRLQVPGVEFLVVINAFLNLGPWYRGATLQIFG